MRKSRPRPLIASVPRRDFRTEPRLGARTSGASVANLAPVSVSPANVLSRTPPGYTDRPGGVSLVPVPAFACSPARASRPGARCRRRPPVGMAGVGGPEAERGCRRRPSLGRRTGATPAENSSGVPVTRTPWRVTRFSCGTTYANDSSAGPSVRTSHGPTDLI